MVEETLTVGDTEVVVRQTDSGFEVEEAEEEPEGTYIRFVSENSPAYGCEIPIDADYVIKDEGHKIYVGWHQEDNIDDRLKQQGATEMRSHEGTSYSGYAVVAPEKTRIVNY